MLPKYILVRDVYAVTKCKEQLPKSPYVYKCVKVNSVWTVNENLELDSLIEYMLDETQVVNECYLMILGDPVWSGIRNAYKHEAVIKIKIASQQNLDKIVSTLDRLGDTYKVFY